MPARQAKRPYAGSQSQITSYFTPGTTSLPAPPTPSQYQPPTLPNQIQSSLLSVGMRIRKSVPEGYKTGSYSAFNLFSDTTPVTKSNFASASPSSTPAAPKYKGTRPRAGIRELTPFCGLMKVGGMSVQGYHESGETIEDEDEEDYEGRIWDSSQESMLSNDSVGSYGGGNGSKRRFVDEEDGENAFGQGGNGGRALMDVGDRRIAMPRSRKSEKDRGSEMMRFGGDGNADVDFEEADFLDYNLADEVQMGGV
ncbi:hypothetical protein BCIN_06g02100 [Botrytis cinerea B05.10]|uniref:Uncharacterized protein n=2 Tax=Botryotinia fuckeliana TaxID=40559 RepID=A0A384JJT8_BOTFB|nr:hypothetical protein BCIN_06g02100 [Botrytis cinerea B05.10]ATZ50721.1 hypothetical protein BCIN_06g02100 [Botrytis cinerea B05.10]EMR88471.1 putative ribonucleotide reductase inhibitor protein [Botrytis cinerea BcDW1]